MNENEILGFDPQMLFAANDEPKATQSQGNSLIYKTRPVDAVTEDHVYRATVKLVYNPFDFKSSILDQQSYAMEDVNGWFSVVSSLTNNDTNCPIFKAWKQCRFSKDANMNAIAKPISEGGKFDKRFARYVTIQVLKDKNQPDLEGKYMLWKLPKSVYDIINAKMNPAPESGKAAIPVMDFLFGRSIDLEVTPGPGKPGEERFARETKYICELSEEVDSVVNPDGTSILSASEQTVLDNYVSAMKSVWRSKDVNERNELLTKVNSDPNTLELKKIYNRVLEVIKTQCPNLTEELGYKEWSDNMKVRVQNWIDVVLAGGDPKTAISPNTTVQEMQATVAQPTQVEPVSMVDDTPADDDLPF